MKVQRPRVRDRAGKEVGLESWEVFGDGDLLLGWALNLMILNVSTRKYRCPVRLHEEFKRRIKTQCALHSAETAAMLFWAPMASRQITMRKVDGWQILAQTPTAMPLEHAA